MDKSPYKWKQPSMTRSPIGKGKKTKEKVENIFGKGNTARKFITGRQ